MIDNNELINMLKKEINNLERIIKYRKLNNICNFLVSKILLSDFVTYRALPLIITSIILINSSLFKDNRPFKRNEIFEKATVKTIDTSNGKHLESTCYDFVDIQRSIEYTTGWKKNDKNLYERTVVSYMYNDDINSEDIMSMTKEELDQVLTIINIRTISKSVLSSEDSIYEKDSIVITDGFLSDYEYITRLETIGENILNSFFYLILVLGIGYQLSVIEEKILKKYIEDERIKIKASFKVKSEKDIEELKKILEIKKANFNMISDNLQDNKKGYGLYLRKK